MLVLSRRVGDSIRIGDDIVVTVLEVGRDAVRLGIDAPRSVSVHREEVYREIVLANQDAAAVPADRPASPATPVLLPRPHRPR